MSDEYETEEFEHGADHVEEVDEPESFESEGFAMPLGNAKTLGQYVSALLRYLVEGVVLVTVLYLLTPAAERASLRDMGMLAVTVSGILVLLDLFGGMGLAARLGAGLGIGFRLVGATAMSVL